MKKYLYMAVAAIAVLSSCDKNSGIIGGGNDFTMDAPVFTATIESDATTKTTLVEGSTAGKLTKVAWLNTDQVFIVTADEDCNQGVVGTYNVTPGSPATTSTLNPGTLKVNNSITTKNTVALYPASYSYVAALDAETIIANGTELIDAASMFNMPLTQQYNGADISQIAPMVAVETTGRTQLEFKNIAALLAITVKAEDFASVNSIKVSSDKIMNGLILYYPKTGIFESLPMPSLYTDANKVTTLNCQNAGANTTIASGESKTFYVSIPPATYEYLQIEVTDGTKTKTMRTTAASITVARNMIYPITFKDNQTPAPVSNLLAGEFSVSATKKVKFTKGNLYWDGSAFQFEANQTDYPTTWGEGDAAGKHVGHFYWTNWTDYNSGTAAYMPYASSYAYSAQSTSDEFWCGEAHKLTVAGTSDLYALSGTEWQYLKSRKENKGIRNWVSINGKYCAIIVPDDVIGTYSFDYDKTVYSAEEWASAESAGFVCLPTSGLRPSGIAISAFNNVGMYWRGTPSVSANQGQDIMFKSDDFNADAADNRYFGFAIRLVQTVDAQTDEAEGEL